MVLEINSPLSHDKAIAEMPSINSESKAPDLEVIKLPTSKKRAVRNSTIIGASYFLYFAGFWSLSALQSTMNSEGGMGVDSQAVIYLCSMLSCFFPELLIEKFGTKTTYVVALSLSLPYIAANFSLRWDTLIISSVLYGLASGPYNAALSCYNDEMSSRYAKASNEKRENVEATFFGLFMFFGEFCQVVGNLIAYYALIGGRQPPPQNFTVQTECGINFDPSAYNGTNTNLDPPSDRDRYILIGAYLLLGVLAVALSLLLDPLGNDVKEVKGCRSVSQRVISAVKHLKKPHQLLLLPLTIFIGMEGSFYAADVTEAFIACSWGVHHVGFVTICFGVCGALMSILVGPLVKCTNQLCVILFAALVNIVTFAMLFFWVPKPDHPVTYFIFAGVWGMTDAIWWSQIAALYGLMFPQDREAAFSNFFFWSFLGYFLSYSYANYFNVAVKINIMMTFLIVGITLYLIGQVKIKCCSTEMHTLKSAKMNDDFKYKLSYFVS